MQDALDTAAGRSFLVALVVIWFVAAGIVQPIQHFTLDFSGMTLFEGILHGLTIGFLLFPGLLLQGAAALLSVIL